MKVAMRRTAQSDATFIEKLAVKTIKARLATVWPHAGIVIGDNFYHASGRHNLEKTTLTPARWDIIDIGDEFDEYALWLFNDLISKGSKYDWIELLDFTPIRPFIKLAHKSDKIHNYLITNVYCYQLVLWALRQERPKERATPELIYFEIIKILNNKSSDNSLLLKESLLD